MRRSMRAARRLVPAPERIAAAEALAVRLLALTFAPRSGHVAGYWAMQGEIPLHAWQMRLSPDLVYCLPVLHDDGRLRFVPWRPGEPLEPNRHGIPEPVPTAADRVLEPQDMDLVVAPLVAFDVRCQRLGMGGGWYDRTFAFRLSAAAPPWLVGAAFESQRVPALDTEVWDVPLDAVCTEHATHLGPTA